MKDRSAQLLIAALIVSILVSVVFAFTYPLNVGQSDNPTYLAMIITGNSNLFQASGYPATVHLLFRRILPILPAVSIPNGLPSDIGADWFSRLRSIQFGMHLVLFLAAIFLCTRTFGNSVAAVVALGWGSNLLFLSNVDAAAPEWLQAHALMVTLLLQMYARRLEAGRKVLLYCLAAGVFSVAYLAKYNSMLFAISLLILLVLDRASWRFKALQAVGSVGIFLVLTSAYAHLYHQRSTGSSQLSFDHAWVLTAALPEDYVSTSPSQLGTNSLRWASLARVTPPEYSRAGAVEKIGYGPSSPEVRQHYDQQFDRLLQMTRAEMIQFIQSNPLPQGYSQWSSAVPLYFYYGLERTDALGTEVYKESLQSHPWFHIRKVAVSLGTFFISGLKTIPTFPTFADSMGYTFVPPDKIVPPAVGNPYFLQYYNPTGTVSFYGVKIMGAINTVTSSSFAYLLLNIAALAGMFRLKSDLHKIAAFALFAGLLAFVSASGVLLGLRQKELIALTPAYFLLLSIGLLSAGRYVVEVGAAQASAQGSSAKARRRKK